MHCKVDNVDLLHARNVELRIMCKAIAMGRRETILENELQECEFWSCFSCYIDVDYINTTGIWELRSAISKVHKQRKYIEYNFLPNPNLASIYFRSDWLIGLFIYLLIDWLIIWLIDWFVGCLLDWFINWLFCWLVACLMYWLIDWLV